MKKRRTLVIALLLIAALAIGIGYATFSVEMTLSGGASMNATECAVVFEDATLNAGGAADVTLTKSGTGTITLTTNLAGFKSVGDTATVTVIVSNPHDFDVQLNTLSFKADGKTNADGVRYLNVEHTFVEGTTVEAGDTYEFTFTVTCGATSASTVNENFTLQFYAEAN